jgi:hypothetical protein
MLLSLVEKLHFTCSACLFYGGPDSAAPGRDLLVSFATRAAFEIIETISGKNRVRVRVNKPGQYDSPASVNDFTLTHAFLNLGARPDGHDHSIVNQHSPIVYDRQLRHFRPNPRSFRSGQRDKLRSVQNSQGIHDIVELLKRRNVKADLDPRFNPSTLDARSIFQKIEARSAF